MAVSDAPHHSRELRLNTAIRDFGNEPPQQTQGARTGSLPDMRAGLSRNTNAAKREGVWPSAVLHVPSYSRDGESAYPDGSIPSPSDSQPSSVELFIQNRRTSINFDPQLTLDSGHRQSLNEPLTKPVRIRPRGRSLLQAMSDDKTRSHRAHSESDNSHYDPITGELLPIFADRSFDDPATPHIGELRHPLLPTTVDALARESQSNLSLDSMLNNSPPSAELLTPKDPQDILLSPTTFSPAQHAKSYEDMSSWQRRRRADRVATENFLGGTGSMRSALRQSRRSTSSSAKSPTSAASSWLRGFSSSMADSAIDTSCPDSEGQTIGDDYVLGRQIGFGGFSTIHEVTQITQSGEQRKLAAKVVRKSIKEKSADENEQFQAEFTHEVELWRHLHHQHILPLEAVVHTDDATYCFIPLNQGGTLFDLIRSNRSGLAHDVAQRYAYQLAAALRYLHYDARVAHRDVKPENCLLDTSTDPGNLRLCDFGMAEWISSDESNSSDPPSPALNLTDRPPMRTIGPSETSSLAFAGGSLEYAAPETLRIAVSNTTERIAVNPAVDIWAFGVCVYTMIVGSRPFHHSFQPRVSAAILAGDWNVDKLRKKGTPDIVELVENCLQMDVERRWDADEVMQCAWFSDIADEADDTGDWQF